MSEVKCEREICNKGLTKNAENENVEIKKTKENIEEKDIEYF